MDSFSPRTPEMPQYHILNDYTFNNKGSLLHELYEHEIPPEYHQDSESFLSWHHPPTEYPIIRRATFPYVRQDRDDIHQYPPFYPLRQEPFYNEPPYQRFEETNIKLEDSTPLPQQNTNFYNSPQAMAMPYLSPHANLPVQHTDDAASKETQYLRRRCFNCHTTEPPSWRRSTLNPGKIVCNKCGLYERTHLRARPLRFDELRSGSKSRKPSSKASTSPKQSKLSMIKKEPRDLGLDRRGSLSSGSSAHSGSGASDWDDNASLYSSGSAPTTSFNSPASHNFPLSRDSLSPPQDGGIRLPNNPLSDVASMHHASTTTCILSQPIPHKSHTSSAAYYSSPSLPEVNIVPQVQDYFPHQNSLSPDALWIERTDINGSGLVSSPTGSI